MDKVRTAEQLKGEIDLQTGQPKVGRPPKDVSVFELITKEKELLLYLHQLSRVGKISKYKLVNRSKEKERYIRSLEKMNNDSN